MTAGRGRPGKRTRLRERSTEPRGKLGDSNPTRVPRMLTVRVRDTPRVAADLGEHGVRAVGVAPGRLADGALFHQTIDLRCQITRDGKSRNCRDEVCVSVLEHLLESRTHHCTAWLPLALPEQLLGT